MACPKNPTSRLFNMQTPLEPAGKHPLSVPQILCGLLEDVEYQSTNTSYLPMTPPWTKIIPYTHQSLLHHGKKEASPSDVNQSFMQSMHTIKPNITIFTDASKNEQGVGCAAIKSNNILWSSTLPKYCSIHTGELYVILQALKTVNEVGQVIGICTDSLLALHSIKNPFSTNGLVQEIHDICQVLNTYHSEIHIIWIPSHRSIPGNEQADLAAKDAIARKSPTAEISSPGDLISHFKQSVRTKWLDTWNQSNPELAQTGSTRSPPNNSSLNRKDTIIIRRLRIGHTRVTHGFLMTREAPPNCITCNTPLSCEHILIICPQYSQCRTLHRIKPDLRENLSTIENQRNVIDFLKDIDIYNCI
ncbi:uncharacterized protein [Euwallacea fornicatus]|uniref:uncharacterized protein n=1 Tax=Euwallacea fornicatus TaxID=995702 RepID=UPI00338D92BE